MPNIIFSQSKNTSKPGHALHILRVSHCFIFDFKVGGIFMIFIWIFVDQQFIQMGKNKKDKQYSNNNLVIHSAPPVASITQKIHPSASIQSLQKVHHLQYSGSTAGSENGFVPRRRAVTPNPSSNKIRAKNMHLLKGTQR